MSFVFLVLFCGLITAGQAPRLFLVGDSTMAEKPLVGTRKVVCLDYFFNNEWKTLPNAQPFRFHYVWEDTSNSGFSELGKSIIRLGAKLDTLNVAPTPENLAHVSIYLIVDPDTPAETPEPHYLDEKAAKAIVEWVRLGGILLLMGNDKGNAEFEHFNMLAENFGIHFNDDSRNGVKGRDFETGAFTSFPDHPIFKNVEKIFIKELSTIKYSGRPILADQGDVIMVYSKFGSGAVFAVGDPWFYNEYFDNRKLPEGFQNRRAAENLFRWLLRDARKVMTND
jgi:unsaturated rhamnogalacturonyl hydrolase